MTRKPRARALAIVVVGASLSVGYGCTKLKKDAVTAEPEQAIHVETALVAERAMPRSLLLAGSLTPNQKSDLAANAKGQVVKTFVERGDYVSRGALVVQLDTRNAMLNASESKANLESARASEQLAQDDCKRYETLLKQGAITQQEHDKATSQCQTTNMSKLAAEARERIANQALDDAMIRAPFNGLVEERFVSLGEYVNADTKVLTLLEIDPVRLELTVPEADIGQIQPDLTVNFEVSAFPNVTFPGRVRYIGPAVRSSTRDLIVEAVVPNHDRRLRPGMFATARVATGTMSIAVVPKTAIQEDEVVRRVYVVNQNTKRVEERLVQIGATDGDVVAIVKGVVKGDHLVVHPTDTIRDGVLVE